MLNVLSSVAIIFVNKKLMSPTGYGFGFATTLCAMHFATCAVVVRCATAFGLYKLPEKPPTVPFIELLVFVAMASASIASLNISLMVNSVGIYQIAKLLIIPFTCFLETLVFRTAHFTIPMLLAVGLVLSGLAIITVSDVTVQLGGLVWACASIVSSSFQQVFCGRLQRKHNISSHELLSKSAPLQALLLVACGPFIDKAVSQMWIHKYEYNVPALMLLFASCMVAVLVNTSQFFCLGRFSAVTFQVLGHLKTILVLVGGWTILKEAHSTRQIIGCVLSVFGMVLYGYFASGAKRPAERVIVSIADSRGGTPESTRLLSGGGSRTEQSQSSV
mmetsp:Transcript_2902/g.8175  ORF Transcript_2902/g.8175 Transcript_2902/m.8175 type:complete len:332 (-) Transcript_2902:1264-2259(-)